MWSQEAVGLPGLTRAFAYRIGIHIMSLSPVGEGGLWIKHIAASLLRVVGLCSCACDGLALWLRRWRCLSELRHTADA